MAAWVDCNIAQVIYSLKCKRTMFVWDWVGII